MRRKFKDSKKFTATYECTSSVCEICGTEWRKGDDGPQHKPGCSMAKFSEAKDNKLLMSGDLKK